MSRSSHTDFRKRQQTFPFAAEKQRIRDLICQHGRALPNVNGIFTFPGETEKDVVNFHKHFPKAKIAGVENDPTVAIQCHYKDYGIDFTLFRVDFHQYINDFVFPYNIDIAWLDYKERTTVRCFQNAKIFADTYMAGETILAVTFIHKDNLAANNNQLMTVLAHRNPVMLDEILYNATKKTPMQCFIVKLN